MTKSTFEIRALQSAAEIDAFLRIAIEAFSPDKDPKTELLSWQQELDTNPSLHPECIRGAFDPQSRQIVGGYFLWHNMLCLGTARLKTGCIGGVAVDPSQRKRGAASALMEDAIACVHAQELVLLFLTGIPDFYHHFGYTSVTETTDLYLKRKHIQALSLVDTIQTREATIKDATTLLALYQQHHHRFIGSFDRSLVEQEYILTQPNSELCYLLAEDQTGQAVGYLLIEQSHKKVSQIEVAATTWPVISALLQEHERRLSATLMRTTDVVEKDDVKDKSTIRWSVPEDTFLFYHLVNHIPFRCERQPYYSADWMARVGDVDRLIENLLPLWSQRLADAQLEWPGILHLTIDQHPFALIKAQDDIRQTEIGEPILYDVKLTNQAFVQLCFGFRPVAWFAAQPEQTIPDEIVPLLEALFPLSPSWVAGSDFF